MKKKHEKKERVKFISKDMDDYSEEENSKTNIVIHRNDQKIYFLFQSYGLVDDHRRK
jgi:hypothetical protein